MRERIGRSRACTPLESEVAAVCGRKLGRLQVLKKWLPYWEYGALGRTMSREEVQHFTDTDCCIAIMLVEVYPDTASASKEEPASRLVIGYKNLIDG